MTLQAHTGVAPAAQAQKPSESERSFVKRWKHEKLFDKGFVAVPSRFLQLYARLKPYPLSSGEALFVLHLMEFKWDASAPFPGYKTIAARMGVSDKMVRRHAQSLETKKYLRRETRIGQTNLFDLSLLFDALARAADQEDKAERRSKSKKQTSKEALLQWHQKMLDAFRMMSEGERKELAEWEQENLNGGSVATSDWPGWERFIGPKPE